MGKVVDGVELLRMIRDGEIERGRKINLISDIDNYSDTYYFSGCNIRHLKGDYEIGSERLLNKKFKYELLDKEIDIQSIKGIDINLDFNNVEKWEDEMQIASKIDELIKAIKQLDRTMKGIK